MRVLTWNLLHGRAVPSAGRDLRAEFAAALASWEWDVALLQEVPPWWPPWLATTLRARERLVLTSRNGLLPLRRGVATRWPDLIKSNGGGANAILVRGQEIVQARTRRLRWWPERRWLQAVRLGEGTWVGNLHATVRDAPAALREGQVAASAMLAWAAGAPAVLGGDFNLREAELSLDGFSYAGGHDVDHVFTATSVVASGSAEVLDRGSLSDHAPVRITLGS